MLTQQTLKSILHYNPDTGIFTYLIANSNRVKVGDIAGCLHPNGYIYIQINYKPYRAHRLAWLYMYGKFPDNQVDHINGIRSDNRIVNLRDVTNQENGRNRRITKRNTSGFTGVCWYKQCSKCQAQIRVNSKQIHLGLFDNKEDAIATREQANIDYGYHINHGSKKY